MKQSECSSVRSERSAWDREGARSNRATPTIRKRTHLMKYWTYAINSYYLTASIHLYEMPWYAYFAEYLVDRGFLSCSNIPSIPFPDIWEKKRDTVKGCVCEHKEVHCKNHDDISTLKSWYGDLSQLWHGYVCDSLFNFAWKHQKLISVEITWDKLKKLFTEVDDVAYFKKCEEEHEKYLAEEVEEESKQRKSQFETLDSLTKEKFQQ